MSAALPHLASRLAQGGALRIVAFGSSSTAGSGASSRAAAYPAQLQDELTDRLHAVPGVTSVAVLNRGVGGEDAETMSRRLERDVLAERPDLVIWQTGSNDPLNGVPVERFVSLTRDGILQMRRAGIDVVLMDQQWCPKLNGTDGAGRYGEALHRLAAELQVPVIRRTALMQGWAKSGLLTPAQMIGPDGLHMTDAGYDRLASAVADELLAGTGRAPVSARR